MNTYYCPAAVEDLLQNDLIGEVNSDYVLINASSIKPHQVEMYKEKIKNSNKKILVDSGGFQLLTGVLDYINPKDVIKIQNELADIGFILDVPPLRSTDESTLKSCIAKTKENILSVKDIPRNFDYYFVLHSHEITSMERWFNELEHLDTFEGISTKGNTKQKLLLGLMYISTTSYTKHHILGVGSNLAMTLINYFYNKEPKVMERVTFDSSSPLVWSRNKRLFFPFINSTLWISKYEGKQIESFDVDRLIKDHRYFFIQNINQYNYQSIFIRDICKDEKETKEFFNTYGEYFEIIDYFFEHGKDIHRTIEKYSKFFELKPIGVSKEPNLFSF